MMILSLFSSGRQFALIILPKNYFNNSFLIHNFKFIFEFSDLVYDYGGLFFYSIK